MKIMTGIDLHSNNALCGLMDESGQRLVHKKLPCESSAVLQLLDPYKERIATVAIESTYNWYWLADGLREHGYHVVLANPARMKPYDGLKHTDDVSDAFFLTELLRLNILPTGQPRIARSFNCGKKPSNQSSPAGAAEKIVAENSVAPPGLMDFLSRQIRS